jgi:hypothetical protein
VAFQRKKPAVANPSGVARSRIDRCNRAMSTSSAFFSNGLSFGSLIGSSNRRDHDIMLLVNG